MLGIPYTGSGVSACIRCADKVLAKHAFRDAGLPTPGLLRLERDRVQGARRRRRAAGHRGAPDVPDRRQARAAGLGARHQVRAQRRRRAGRARRRVLLRPQGRCSSATSTAATSRSRSSTAQALPIVEAVPVGGADFYDFEARYEIGRTDFVCPAEIGGRRHGAGAGARARRLPAARLRGLRARRPHVRPRHGRPPAARGQPGAGADRDVAAAPRPPTRRGSPSTSSSSACSSWRSAAAARRPSPASRWARRRGSPRA